jgi:hypothetical protein
MDLIDDKYSSMNSISDYLPFEYNKSMKLKDIALSTKKLIASSTRYNKYIKKYNTKTQIVSFKLPEITSYPIFKNKELIPVGKIANETQEDFFSNKNSIAAPILITEPASKVYLTNLGFENTKKKPKLNDLFVREKTLIPSKVTTNFKYRSDYFYDYLNTLTPSKNTLNYDHNEIYNATLRQCAEVLSDKLKEYRDYQGNNAKTLSHVYNKGTYEEVSVTLHSIKLEFKNIDDKNKKNIVIYFPLSFLPLFYHMDCESFKLCLQSWIKCYPAFSDVKLEESEIIKWACNYKENLIKIENCLQDYLKRSKYNKIEFFWIIGNLYLVEIKLPCLEILFTRNSIKLEKFLDTELIIHFVKNNFENWEFYASNYLQSFKDFRILTNKLFSKSFRLFNNQFFFNAENVPFKSECRVRKFSEKFTNFTFLSTQTEKDINGVWITKHFFYVLESFNVLVHNNLTGQTDKIQFNFTQMRTFYKLSQLGDIEYVLKKIIIFDKNGKFSIDEEFLKKIDMFEFSETMHNKKNDYLDISIKYNSYNSSWPCVKRYVVHNGQFTNKVMDDSLEISLGKTILEKFVDSDITEWIRIIENEQLIKPKNSKSLSNNFVIKPSITRQKSSVEKMKSPRPK